MDLNLVRLLPFCLNRMRLVHSRSETGWGGGRDFRTICPCQVHARRERTVWRRSVRAAHAAARSLKTRGVALIVGVPLAFGALEFPTEAMNVTVNALRGGDVVASQLSNDLPIFTTREIRDHFLEGDEKPQTFTLEVVKEEFFRTYVPYGSIIYREARRNDLAPELVAAVVEAESDFRPRLISHKNAQGLMQIVPETGRLMGADDLFNPADNIAAGTRYLRYLLDRFGDQRVALAAYNAGEGNVERFGGIPPFPETVNYLHRVSARTAHYRQRIRGTFVAGMRMRNSLAVR